MAIVTWSFLIGVGFTAICYVLFAVVNGTWDITKLVEGADGKLSTSKFQWVIWIFAVFIAYITIYSARSLAAGQMANPITDIPGNVLAVLGFSTLTATAAKGITQSYVSEGLISKPAAAAKPAGASKVNFADLIRDDANVPDPYKLQLFLWTMLAIVIFIAKMVSIVLAAASAKDADAAQGILVFPDIDSSLMILSGLSAGGYLGKKIVTKDSPKIASITPSRIKCVPAATPPPALAPILVLGDNFGPAQNGSVLSFGQNLQPAVTAWSGSLISASIDPTNPPGVYLVAVIVGGTKSNEMTVELY